MSLGRLEQVYGRYFNGYIADVNFVDGQAYAASYFGEYNAVYNNWVPKKYTEAYGTNGFYLDFKNSGSLGNDANGSNNWTTNNLASTDQILDTPNNNYPIFSEIYGAVSPETQVSGTYMHLEQTSVISDNNVGTSMPLPKTGKWYFEVRFITNTVLYGEFGIGNLDKGSFYKQGYNNSWLGDPSNNGHTMWFWPDTTGTYQGFWNTQYAGQSRYLNTWSNLGAGVNNGSHIFQFAVDRDNGRLYFGFDGAWHIGDPEANDNSGLAIPNNEDDWGPVASFWNSSGYAEMFWNFGQDGTFDGYTTSTYTDTNSLGSFKYQVPSNYKSVCTKNLPDSTVVPEEHFNTVLYTGNSSTQSITGVGFQPDFTWLKHRNNPTAHQHNLFDIVRGATKTLHSNSTEAEETATNMLSSFDSDGFTINTDNAVNQSPYNYVAWNWKAGGTAVSNTNGTITSTVSANADAGFSIVKYNNTGVNTDTVGHGLSKQLDMVIVKSRDATRNWHLGHKDLPFNSASNSHNGYMSINLSGGNAPDNGGRANISNATTFQGHGASGDNYIAYCFHSVPGYSKISSYKGNGSEKGTFVHTGFRPAYVMIKRTDDTGSWCIADNERSVGGGNGDSPNGNSRLRANTTGPEDDSGRIDILSNGFKLLVSYPETNAAGGTYIFMAFAEHPFKHSNAR
jgi:hypothetical protein